MARRRTGPGLARAAAFLLSATLLCSPALCAVADGLSGVWEGTLDRGDRHQAIALVFRPEGSSWTGLWYLDGFESGVLEAIRLEGSSLRFRSLTVSFEGSLAGDQLTLSATVKNGGTFPFVVKHTSRDAARLPASVRPEGPVGGEKPKPRDVAPDSVYLAHAVPAGEPPSLHPSLRKGTLLLVGGGAGQEDINARFLALAGGASAARIVYVPTAANLAGVPIEQRAENTARHLGVRKVALLHTLSRREADSEDFVKPLREATAVWFDGGDEGTLINTYMGTRTERELIAVLERGGVIGGSSAGAAIWGSKLVIARAKGQLKGYERPAVEDLVFGDIHEASTGLLRNVLIIPHFTEFHMEKVLAAIASANPGLLALGVDEATALEVHGESFRVFGRGAVYVFDNAHRAKGGPLALRSGSRYEVRGRA